MGRVAFTYTTFMQGAIFKILLFIQQYLLHAYHVLFNFPNLMDMTVNETNKTSAFSEAFIGHLEEIKNKQIST